MTDDSAEGDSVVTDRIYAGIAVVAALLALPESVGTPWTIACILLALVPWALVVLRRPVPLWLFTTLSIVPVIPVIIANDAGVVTFMTTTAASRVASRTDNRWFLAGLTAVVLVVPFLPPPPAGDPWHYGAEYFAFGNAFAVLVGVLLRRANRLAADLRAADARLAEASARDERQRIARDVHDLVAHSLTVVVLHIGGARRVLRDDPRAAEAALADAERVCRESLDGIRGVVGLLREGDERPGVSLDFEQLADSYRAAGRPVTLTVDGDPSALPLAVRVALYRVVQESLANAARHTDATIDVAVTVTDGAVAARIANPLHQPVRGRAASAGGYGLLGLGEQVEALGGALTGGPDGGDWVVTCRLPLRDATSPPATVGDLA